MDNEKDPTILKVDRVDNAVRVTFDDGSDGIYPAVLLDAAKGVGQAIFERQHPDDESDYSGEL